VRLHITTNDVPERQRLDMWEATLHSALGMQAGTMPDAQRTSM
jgi:hypothetical protein